MGIFPEGIDACRLWVHATAVGSVLIVLGSFPFLLFLLYTPCVVLFMIYPEVYFSALLGFGLRNVAMVGMGLAAYSVTLYREWHRSEEDNMQKCKNRQASPMVVRAKVVAVEAASSGSSAGTSSTALPAFLGVSSLRTCAT